MVYWYCVWSEDISSKAFSLEEKILFMLFHVSVFVFINSCYHCLVARPLISQVVYGMLCLPSYSGLLLLFRSLMLFLQFISSALFCFLLCLLADKLVSSIIILRGLQILYYYYHITKHNYTHKSHPNTQIEVSVAYIVQARYRYSCANS